MVACLFGSNQIFSVHIDIEIVKSEKYYLAIRGEFLGLQTMQFLYSSQFG